MQASQQCVLLVEDNVHDVILLKHALQKIGFPCFLHVAENGERAKSYIRGEGEFADRTEYPFPKMVLTDLKMPKMDGFELVEWMRADPKLSSVFIMVLSASPLEEDRLKALQLGVNAFFTKPQHSEDFVPLVKFIRERWSRNLNALSGASTEPTNEAGGISI